ncbi:unnamed protein product [Sphagnum jensenii]|uniref:Uncharacterized protein n=1 Tax=Sphagnum jensenii TaxID=128206 RepID=A0ABP1AFT8_9BRYO
MVPTKKKRSYEWKDLYADEYGLKVVARNVTTSKVETVSYRFCIAFGREESIDACNGIAEEEKLDNNDIGPPSNTNNVDVINKVVDGGGNKRKQQKRIANHKQWTKPKFRTDNFTKHLQQQHAKRWEEYNHLRQSYTQEVNSSLDSSILETPLANRFKKFFETTFMLAYFEADRLGKQRAAINIGKDIVETVILGLLFDVDADDCAKVVSTSREELGQAAKIGRASENDVVKAFLAQKEVVWARSEQWWLTLLMLHKMLDLFWLTSASLQASNLTLRQQTSNLSSLVIELKTTIGATHETNTCPNPTSNALLEEEHNSSLLLIRYGPFTLLRDQAEWHIKGTNLLVMSMANRLPADDLEEVTWDVSRVYVQAMYSVAVIVAERDARKPRKDRRCSSNTTT